MVCCNEYMLAPHDPFLIDWNLFIILRSILFLLVRIPLLLLSFCILFSYYVVFAQYPRTTQLDKFTIFVLLQVFGINITIENLKINKTYFPKIIMSNHLSIFDHFINSYVLSKYKLKYTYVMAECVKKTPLAWHKLKWGGVAIKSGENTIDKITNFIKTNDVRNDGRFIIYPEGRHGNGKFILRFRTGGFLYKKDIQPILITSDSQYLSDEEIKKGYFGLAMKSTKTGYGFKYVCMYILRLLINPSINVTVKLLPVFKKEEYMDNDDHKKSANKLRDIMLTYEKRMQKFDY